MNAQGFTPSQTQSISVTSSSGSATFTAAGINTTQLRIANTGLKTAFVTWGVGAQTATTSMMPILPNTIELFNKGVADTVAAICAGSDTTTLYVTAGEGS